MRFEGGETEEDELEATPRSPANAWFLFLPVVLIGLWVLAALASSVSLWLTRDAILNGPSGAEALDGAFRTVEVLAWLGGMGWLLLILFFPLLLARKGYPRWWWLGALCVGPNLLLYIAFLLLPKRSPAPTVARASPFDLTKPPRVSSALLKDSFVCEACDSVINYGVSECRECGALFRYVDGKPALEDS